VIVAMIEDAVSKPVADAARARFWVRLVAFGIDVLIINMLVAVVGLALTGLTDGRVRVAGTVLNFVDCTRGEPLPRGIAVPDGFEVADASRCATSVLGIAHDWTLVARERIAAGASEEDRRKISLPLNAAGQPVQAFYLDGLMPLVLAAYLLLLEWRFGMTPGKHIFGIAVRSLDRTPMNLIQAGKRLLMRLIVFGSASMIEFEPESSTETHRITFGIALDGSLDLGIWSAVLNALAFVYFTSFIITTSRRTLPLHDRWAETEAIRLNGD
jgi:uncharacterized RDD family membrane protein YckC